MRFFHDGGKTNGDSLDITTAEIERSQRKAIDISVLVRRKTEKV